MTIRAWNRLAISGSQEAIAVGYRIICSKCGEIDTVSAPRRGGLPPEVVSKKFGQKGWVVTKSASHDLCPKCGSRHNRIIEGAAPAVLYSSLKSGAITFPAEKILEYLTPPTETTMAKPQLVPPRTMTRDDRRIIFEKLNELYVSETVGYAKGWSDKRVAEDLGVPQAWVAEIRDQNHGPENSTEEAREFVERSDLLLGRIDEVSADFAAKMAGFAQQIEALKAEARQLAKVGTHIGKQFK